MPARLRPVLSAGQGRAAIIRSTGAREAAVLLPTALAFAVVGAIAALALYRLPLLVAIGALIAPLVLAAVAWRPILGVYGGLIAIPLEAFDIRLGSLDSTLAEMLFLLTAGVAFVPVLVKGRAWRSLAAAHVWFAGLLFVAVVGYFFAADPGSVVKLVRNAAAFLVLSILVSTLTRDQIERLLLVLVVSGGIVGLIAILTTGEQEAQAGTVDVSGRASAAFSHPNVLGFYLVLTLGPALALMAGRDWRRRLLVGAAIVAMAGGLALTLSRSAILGAAVVLLVLMASSRFRRTGAVLAIVVAVVALLNVNTISQSREVDLLQERLSTVNVSGAERDPRVPIWREAPRIIVEHPVFGVGEGNFHVASSAHGLVEPGGSGWDHAHNLLLTVTAELGLVGLAVFVGFLVAVAGAAWRGLKARGPTRRILLGVVASLSGLFVTGLVEYPPRAQAIMALTLILVGVVVALERADVRRDSPPREVVT